MILAVVLGYFVIIAVIGFLAYRRAHSSTDEFFVADRNLGTFVNSWAFLASLASGGSVLASVGTTLAMGYSYQIAMLSGAPVGFVVASILVARPLRQLGKYTVPDFFNHRYGGPILRWVAPVVIVVASMAYIVAQMKGAAIVAEYLLGWDYSTGIWVTGTLFILYVTLGGFLSVTWNDIFQGMLMFGMIAFFAILALMTMNGYGAGMSTALETYPQLGRATAPGESWSILGGFITWATAISVLPHVIMRVYSARDVGSARSSLNVAMILYSIMMLLTTFVLVPLAATTLTPDESADPDGLFFTLTASVFNTFGQGIVAAAVLAAIMSTTAGLLMACNSAIAHDLYRGARPEASQRSTLRVASVATVVVGLICMVLALNPPALLIVLYTGAVALLASAFFAPMVLGIWWPKATRAGATAGLKPAPSPSPSPSPWTCRPRRRCSSVCRCPSSSQWPSASSPGTRIPRRHPCPPRDDRTAPTTVDRPRWGHGRSEDVATPLRTRGEPPPSAVALLVWSSRNSSCLRPPRDRRSRDARP